MILDTSDIVKINVGHLEANLNTKRFVEFSGLAIEALKFSIQTVVSEKDHITVFRLAIRMINAAGAAGILAENGYYEQAVSQLRDLVEVGTLVTLFSFDPTEINRWRACDQKARQTNFSADAVRKRLFKHDSISSDRRKKVYDLFTLGGTHPHPHAIDFNSPNRNTVVGPFPDEPRIRAFSYEIAIHLGEATDKFRKWFDSQSFGDRAVPAEAVDWNIRFDGAWLKLLEIVRRGSFDPDEQNATAQ